MRANPSHLRFLKALLLAAGLSACAPSVPPATVPRQYNDTSLFLSAIKQDATRPLDQAITGITVPHHLLARDLMAQAFGLVAGHSYDRVILLSPDHFFLGDTDISVTTQAFDTVFGTLKADAAVSEALRGLPAVGTGSFFYREHGINALTPFIKYHFPDAAFTAITFKGASMKEDLRAVADALEPLLKDRTLIVQSTDYSHFLTPSDAKAKDQETLRLIASGDADAIHGLDQPEHMDAIDAQWLQMTLQREAFHASPVVLQNRNSQAYANEPVTDSTSYVTQIYTPEFAPMSGSGRYVFAGDTLLGRGMAAFAEDPSQADAFVKKILGRTGDAPMIVNLEGVMQADCPEAKSEWTLCMKTEPTLRILKALNVVAVGTANNHAYDLGADAYASMLATLRRNGIRVLERNATLDFPEFRLAGFTDVDNSPEPRANLLYESDIKQGASPSPLPSFVFVHWGDEYSATMNARQTALADVFGKNGFALVIGAHSHRASPLSCTADQCVLPSLGNFLFDQSGPKVSGQLLEVRFFPQGTYALRTIGL